MIRVSELRVSSEPSMYLIIYVQYHDISHVCMKRLQNIESSIDLTCMDIIKYCYFEQYRYFLNGNHEQKL